MKTKISTALKLFIATLSFSLFLIQSNAQCVANWIQKQAGCLVKFGDISQGNPTQWSWDFGNGQTSSLQDPVYTYSASGTYNVCLIITVPTPTGGNCYDTLCKQVTVQCGATGIADLIDEQSISIYPNPFTTQTTFSFRTEVENSSLIIYDLAGKEVTHSVIPNGVKNFSIERKNLSRGMYFYQIISEDKSIAMGKLIIN